MNIIAGVSLTALDRYSFMFLCLLMVMFILGAIDNTEYRVYVLSNGGPERVFRLFDK